MKSESEKAAACAMFDAFCKEVLRNAMIDNLRKSKHVIVHELIVAEPERYLGAMERTEDNYAPDHLSIEFDGCSYTLDNPCCCSTSKRRESKTARQKTNRFALAKPSRSDTIARINEGGCNWVHEKFTELGK